MVERGSPPGRGRRASLSYPGLADRGCLALSRWTFRRHRIEIEVLGPFVFALDVDGETRARPPRDADSETPLELDGDRLVFTVRGDRFELRHGDARVPPVDAHLELRPVPPGARCADHPAAAAAVACARCGRFACAACASPDEVRCRACGERPLAADDAGALSEAAWRAIIVAALLLGGAVLFLLR